MSVYSCLSPWGYLGFCPLSRIFLGDYSDPYGAAFSLIQNRTDDFSSSFAPLRRKALQPSPQTFATAPAKHCNRSRKRLREKPSFSICPPSTCIRPCKYVRLRYRLHLGISPMFFLQSQNGSVDIPWGIIEPVLRHRCPH